MILKYVCIHTYTHDEYLELSSNIVGCRGGGGSEGRVGFDLQLVIAACYLFND